MSINTRCRDRIINSRRRYSNGSTNSCMSSLSGGTISTSPLRAGNDDGGQGRWGRKRLVHQSLMSQRNCDNNQHQSHRQFHPNDDDDSSEEDIYYDDIDCDIKLDVQNSADDCSLSPSSISKFEHHVSVNIPPPPLSNHTSKYVIKPCREQKQTHELQKIETNSILPQYRSQRRRVGSIMKYNLRRAESQRDGGLNIHETSGIVDCLCRSSAGEDNSMSNRPDGESTCGICPDRLPHDHYDDIDDSDGYSIITNSHSAPHERTSSSLLGSKRSGRSRYQRRSSITRYNLQGDSTNNNAVVVVGSSGEEETSIRSSMTLPAIPSSMMLKTTIEANPPGAADPFIERLTPFRTSRYNRRRGDSSLSVSPIHRRSSLGHRLIDLKVIDDDGIVAAKVTPSRSVDGLPPLYSSPRANKCPGGVSNTCIGTNHTGLIIRRGSVTGEYNHDVLLPEATQFVSPRRISLDNLSSPPQRYRTPSPGRRMIVHQKSSSSIMHGTGNDSSSSHLTVETVPLSPDSPSDSSSQFFAEYQRDWHQQHEPHTHSSTSRGTNQALMGSAAVSQNRGVARHHKLKRHQTTRSAVHFGTIQIFEFKATIGDNPACSKGCPIMLERFHDTQQSFPVDTYEKLLCWNSIDRSLVAQRRLNRQRQRQHQQRQYFTPDRVGGDNKEKDVNRCPILSNRDRSSRLLRAGYSLDEMAKATMAVQQIQAQRQASVERHGGRGRLDAFVKTMASHFSFASQSKNKGSREEYNDMSTTKLRRSLEWRNKSTYEI
jgi:hypothetical protein